MLVSNFFDTLGSFIVFKIFYQINISKFSVVNARQNTHFFITNLFGKMSKFGAATSRRGIVTFVHTEVCSHKTKPASFKSVCHIEMTDLRRGES